MAHGGPTGATTRLLAMCCGRIGGMVSGLLREHGYHRRTRGMFCLAKRWLGKGIKINFLCLGEKTGVGGLVDGFQSGVSP